MSDQPRDPVIRYASHRTEPVWKTLHCFYSEIEAQLLANELDAHSIRSQIMNGNAKNVFSLYGSMVKVELQVPSDQLEQAKLILSEHLRPENKDLLEPAEPDDALQTRTAQDADGQAVQLLAVASYESARAMQEAALVLETARIEPYLPQLISRSDAPAGVGPRFVLRVAENDLSRARQALSPESAGDDEDELGDDPQCPRCGAWNIYEIKHEISNMILSLVGKSKPEQCECLKCHYMGDRGEFLPRSKRP